MLLPFHLSHTCASAHPPVAGMHPWPADCCQRMPFACRLLWCLWVVCPMSLTTLVAIPVSSACASRILPVTGACLCPATCHRYLPVACRLSPARAGGLPPSRAYAGGLLPVASACLWTSACRWHLLEACPCCQCMLVAFPLSSVHIAGLSPSCATGLLPVFGVHQWIATSHQCTLEAFCLSLVCDEALPPVTSAL